MNIPQSLVEKTFNWLGRENVIWFKHIRGLKGGVNTVLKLNYKKRGIPAHPIHFREGMQIRNFLRCQDECANWSFSDLEKNWDIVVEKCFSLL